jgi:hypothetical protein
VLYEVLGCAVDEVHYANVAGALIVLQKSRGERGCLL